MCYSPAMHWTVVGHQRQKVLVERLIATGRLPHAYLLAGPAGIGKRMFADDVVRALVPPGYGPDSRVIEHDIPVEEVRELKRWMYMRPACPFKTVIVDDADGVGTEAANTLLKVLEEPPSYAKFFLVTGRAGAVMPTIASRCERMDFMPLGDADMEGVLAAMNVDADDRALVGVIAAGRPGRARRLVESGKLPAVARHIGSLEKALKSGLTERLSYAKDVADDDDAPEIADWWLTWVHAQLPERPALAAVARGLADLADVLREPHYNRRLAIETFLLQAGQK